MRINKIQTTPNGQTFGMAYYLKCAKNINTDYHKYYVAQRQVHHYANLKRGICAKGYLKFQEEMSQLILYDVAFDHETKTMQVIKRATGEVVETFDKSTKWQKGINNPNKILSPVKAIYSYIFDPKQFLPYNMLQAGKRAKELEKIAFSIEK